MAGANTAMAGGSFALSMYASGVAAKAKQEQDIRNARLSQQRRTIDMNRETQALLQNRNNLMMQNTADNFNISIAGMKAQSDAAGAMAGSGISGASVNELSNEISRAVAQDRISANRQMRDQMDADTTALRMRNENRVYEAENAYVHDYSKDIKGDMLRAIGSSMEIYSRGN